MRNKVSGGEKYFRIRGRLEQPLDARCFERAGGCIRQVESSRVYSVHVLVRVLCFKVHDTCRGAEKQRTQPGCNAMEGAK
jgi:hypothetical protein